ncbi:MAG: hypothetical protein JF586_15195 [Burkholderiales bacterium]|jgi:hypothetical protein|nr:hypothetical protein [Burkholderiales bacterium]
MKQLAVLYSAIFSGISIWSWICYFGPVKEHLLPYALLSFAALPSSIIVVALAVKVSWILDSELMMLSLTTAVGAAQVATLWLAAMRKKKRAGDQS